jgi:mitochondrial fission protein ELM1
MITGNHDSSIRVILTGSRERTRTMTKVLKERVRHDKELDVWLNGPTCDNWYSEVLEDGTVIITSR